MFSLLGITLSSNEIPCDMIQVVLQLLHLIPLVFFFGMVINSDFKNSCGTLSDQSAGLSIFCNFIFPFRPNKFSISAAMPIVLISILLLIHLIAYSISSILISYPSISPSYSVMYPHLVLLNNSSIYSFHFLIIASASYNNYPFLSTIPPPLKYSFFQHCDTFYFLM